MDSLTIAYRECEIGYFDSGSSCAGATLLVCARGSLCCVVRGQPVALDQGEFLLLPPDAWHMLFARDARAPAFARLTIPLEGAPFGPYRGSDPLAEQILQEAIWEKPHYQAMCGHLLGQLLIGLSRQQKLLPDAAPRGDAAILCRTQKIICAHARQKLSVPSVAQKAGVSASYLTALFHKHLPFSPGEYIRRVKLWESRAMIREGALNFTQIAEALEYSTVHQFSRQFKEVFGITPTEYAKSVRQ